MDRAVIWGFSGGHEELNDNFFFFFIFLLTSVDFTLKVIIPMFVNFFLENEKYNLETLLTITVPV